MKYVDYKSLVPRKPPEGLLDWESVRNNMDTWGLVYDMEWTTDASPSAMLDDFTRGKKRKMVCVRCSACGGEQLLEWCPPDYRNTYGFVHSELGGPTYSGDSTLCPMCETPVLVRKSADIGRGFCVTDELSCMSADVVGPDRALVLTGWNVRREVSRAGIARLKAYAAEAYIFAADHRMKLTGWQNGYSGHGGYFIMYKHEWAQPRAWSETWEEAHDIYNLTPELVESSAVPNCKLYEYMHAARWQHIKKPVVYMCLYQQHTNVENIIISGLPAVLDDLIAMKTQGDIWLKHNNRGKLELPEINWDEDRPSKMLGLTREELRMARDQGWGLLFWRLYAKAKETGEIISEEDIRNVHYLGDEDVLELVGRGPVGKSIRYILKQIEDACQNPDIDMYVDPGDYISVQFLLDYWDMAERCGLDLENPAVRFPQNLAIAHDNVMTMKGKFETKALSVKFRARKKELERYAFEADGLILRPAASQKALTHEANVLDHCVWQYGPKHAQGETAIFFVRHADKPKKPFFTLEFNEKTQEVRQNRGRKNCARTPEVKAFEELWLRWVHAGCKRDEDGNPILPKIKKKKEAAA